MRRDNPYDLPAEFLEHPHVQPGSCVELPYLYHPAPGPSPVLRDYMPEGICPETLTSNGLWTYPMVAVEDYRIVYETGYFDARAHVATERILRDPAFRTPK